MSISSSLILFNTKAINSLTLKSYSHSFLIFIFYELWFRETTRLLKYISNIKSAAGLKFTCSLYTFLVTEGLFSLRTLMLKKLAKKRRERVSRGDTLFWAGKQNVHCFSCVSFVRSSMRKKRHVEHVDGTKKSETERAIYLLFWVTVKKEYKCERNKTKSIWKNHCKSTWNCANALKIDEDQDREMRGENKYFFQSIIWKRETFYRAKNIAASDWQENSTRMSRRF